MKVDPTVAITIVISISGSSLATYLASDRTIRQVTNDFSHKFVAMSYAQQAASSEDRKLDMGDLKEGLDFADRALGKFEEGRE
ncbi:hypothetical protein AKJ41_02055 [candidate division MSBL1 archaeon SCGC-AAA259O05]|uniref:Uncharacterized protein n=1 Tax=candidate division MSBL1 archaeon SCGC-AAA259O05 TaxID=1698271 RepID=A0A133V4E4_9EURY|nr:hypothetical protein AKJ41_02055 [candidate division MSBL1 archaeon SCGC-AAA259O05]